MCVIVSRVCICVCARLKGCSCRRLARIKQTQRLSQMQIAKSATNTACEFICLCACVHVYAALGQLMETKEAMHTHTKHTHAHRCLSCLMQIFLTFTELCLENYASNPSPSLPFTLSLPLTLSHTLSNALALFPLLALSLSLSLSVTKIIAEKCSEQ